MMVSKKSADKMEMSTVLFNHLFPSLGISSLKTLHNPLLSLPIKTPLAYGERNSSGQVHG